MNGKNISKKIIYWYDNNKRFLPWRKKVSKKNREYYTLVSEFMLQQTQVKTVVPYFKNFVKKIPNLKALSNSNKKKVLKLWEGLGYYTRAKNLHKTSKILIKKYNGRIPESFVKLKELPGIGDYTANVLLALIYNQPRVALDGNVKRVVSRITGRKKLSKYNLNYIKSFLSKNIDINRTGDFNEALMELGACICLPRSPKCRQCPLNSF